MGWMRRMAFNYVPGYAREQARRKLQLPAYPISSEVAADNEVRSQVWRLAQSEAFDEILDMLRSDLASLETSAMQVRRYELVQRGLFAAYDIHMADPAAAERATAPFRRWAERSGDDPDVAALVARALQILGVIHRGHDEAAAARPERQARKMACFDEAGALLAKTGDKGSARPLWRRALFEAGLFGGAEPDEIAERFWRYLDTDPENIETFRVFARAFAPPDLEEFARMAATRTRYGAALYAQIYAEIAEVANPAERTNAEWARLNAGYEEALKHWPREIVLNEHARMAALFGEIDQARQLFQSMREVRLDCWAGDPFEVYAWLVGALDRRPEI